MARCFVFCAHCRRRGGREGGMEVQMDVVENERMKEQQNS